MDDWLDTVVHLGPLTTTVGAVAMFALSLVAVASLTPTMMVWAAHLRRRGAAKAAALPAYAGGALGGYGAPFAGARWAARSAWDGFRFVVRGCGLVFRIGLILALLSIWGHLARYAVNRVGDIYQAKSLNPPTHSPLPRAYTQIQHDARTAIRDPQRAAKAHASLLREFLWEWLI